MSTTTTQARRKALGDRVIVTLLLVEISYMAGVVLAPRGRWVVAIGALVLAALVLLVWLYVRRDPPPSQLE